MKTKKILKTIGKGMLFLVSGVIAFILVLLLIVRMNSTGVPDPVKDEKGKIIPGSISVIEDREINGIVQRLSIRGVDTLNPVLLRVHGGPGAPHIPPFYQLMNCDLEDLFTVCYWDQRGSGFAYTPETPDESITLPQIVDDGLAVAEYLKERFGKKKIYIEGLSWGTTVAAYMIQKDPGLFEAYIGIGQMADQVRSEEMSYDFVLDQATGLNDTAVLRQLKELGRPPYLSAEKVTKAIDQQRQLVDKYVPFKAMPGLFEGFKTIMLYNGWTFKQKLALFTSYTYLGPGYEILWPTCASIKLIRDVTELNVPVYILQGELDHYTETSLARDYFDTLQAPLKRWYLFEDAGHAAHWEYPEKYRDIIIGDVLGESTEGNEVSYKSDVKRPDSSPH